MSMKAERTQKTRQQAAQRSQRRNPEASGTRSGRTANASRTRNTTGRSATGRSAAGRSATGRSAAGTGKGRSGSAASRQNRSSRAAAASRRRPRKAGLNELSVLIPGALKWVLFLILVVSMLSRMRGDRISSTTFDQMTQAVTANADLSNTDQSDNQMVRRLYKLTPADYEGVLLYAPKTNMGAEELFLVHLTDKSQKGEVDEAIERRIQTQKNSFKGYGVNQTELLENSIHISRGGYVLYYCGSDPQKVEAAFLKAL